MSPSKKASSQNASNKPSFSGKDAQNPLHSNQNKKHPQADVDNLVPAKDKSPDDMEIF